MKEYLSFSNLFSYREMVSRSLAWGHYFLLLNALLAVFLGLAYVYGAPNTSSFLSFIYLIITNFGHMAFLAFVLFLIVMFPLAFTGNYRYYRVISVVLMTFFHSLLLVDIKMYLYVKAHLSFSVIWLVFTDLDFKTGLNYNFLFIAIPIVIALELAFAKLSTKSLYKLNTRRFSLITSAVLVVAFVTSHLIHIWADANNYDEITTLRTSYPLHYPMTARTFLQSHGLVENLEAGIDDIESMVYPLEKIRYSEEVYSPNVLCVLIENLSYDDVGEQHTPGLLRLAARGETFSNYFLPYDNAAHNIFAISYGLPLRYRPSVNYHQTGPVLVGALNHLEFTQRLFVNPIGNESATGVTGLSNMQIERFEDDAQAVAAALRNLEEHDKKRPFSFAVGLGSLRDLEGNAYRGALTRLDRLVESMVDKLDELGVLENTMVIVSAVSGHEENPGNTSIFNREKQRVPLIIKWPHNLNVDHNNSDLASAFDISPTIGANVAGILNETAQYSIGEDLLQPQNREFIPIENRDLILIGSQYTTIYTINGKAVVENQNQVKNARPNLENLIRAMRDLNRFKE